MHSVQFELAHSMQREFQVMIEYVVVVLCCIFHTFSELEELLIAFGADILSLKRASRYALLNSSHCVL